MQQINIRISDDEKLVLDFIAKSQGISVSEIAKRAILNEISPKRVELAFKLLKDGKLGFKKGWILSGLTYHEFLNEWSKREITEEISEESIEKGNELALILNIEEIKKKNDI